MAKQSGAALTIFDRSFDYGQLPSLTGFHLRRAGLTDFSTFSDAIGDRAITPLRYSVLEVVGSNPGLQPAQLAAILGLTKPAATVAIDFWQSRGCLSRRQAQVDRRTRGIRLTERGTEILAELRRQVAEHDRGLTASLTEDELATLHRLLRKIVDRNAEPEQPD